MKTIKTYATNQDGTSALSLGREKGQLYLCDENGRFVVNSQAIADEIAASWLKGFKG